MELCRQLPVSVLAPLRAWNCWCGRESALCVSFVLEQLLPLQHQQQQRQDSSTSTLLHQPGL